MGLELSDVCGWGFEREWGLGVFVTGWCLSGVGLIWCLVGIGGGVVVC